MMVLRFAPLFVARFFVDFLAGLRLLVMAPS